LYALDITLDLPAATEREEVENKMNGHIIETVALLGLCGAPKE
jgi:phosphatidylethanolamine-binding protein (PEBP) family uncharacterized protein